MIKFFPLKVKRIKRETSSCVSVALDIPLSLKETFRYKQGQYLTFKLKLNGEVLRRSYSICSNPLQGGEMVVAVKKVNGGKVSAYFNDVLKEGDVLEVMPPEGRFYTELDPIHRRSYVLFAGGSGITPMLSIISAALQMEPESSVSLFYGNLDEESTIFKTDLETLETQYPGRFFLHLIYDKPKGTGQDPFYQGILSKEKVNEILDKFSFHLDAEYFICGPGIMMDNVVHVLEARAVEKKYIHVEYFSAPVEELSKIEAADQVQYIDSEMLLICDGDESIIQVKAGQTVLQAALDAHLDAPYSCRAGSCSTCRARLIEGKVKMNVNYSLLDSEVEDGFILTCQSHPITPRIYVDYDRAR
jgi:ring-1,2-phenylacetyl-CoA epoxidase subunit PaaE